MKTATFILKELAKAANSIMLASIFTLCVGSLGVCIYKLIKEIAR